MQTILKTVLTAILLILSVGCGARDETPSTIEPLPQPPVTSAPEAEPLPEDDPDADVSVEPVNPSVEDNAAINSDISTGARKNAAEGAARVEEEPISDDQYVSRAEAEAARAAASRARQENASERDDVSTDPEQPATSLASPFGLNENPLIETELLRLINEERSRRELPLLGIEPSMQFAAAIRAEEALESVSHTRPDGTPYHTAFDEAGFPYAGKYHGENLAFIEVTADSFDETAIAIALLQQWEQSPGHEQNLFSPNFVQTGIGICVRQDDDMYTIGAAQMFASL